MKNFSIRQATIALLTSTALLAPPALGTEYTVSTPTTVTNGAAGNVIDGTDILTVDANGSIVTAGNNTSAVNAPGDNNIINNAGLLSTQGTESYGIEGEDYNMINNTGSINTTGLDASAIYIDDFNSVVNSGSIGTTGEDADGIFVRDNNSVLNSGTINTSGEDAYGIFVRGNNSVLNSGTINTSGDYADGISAFDDNIFTNTGTITTAGQFSDGFNLRDNNIVNNSGYVISEQANSFRFQGTGNTLNLAAPSFIGGVIDLGTDNQVSITTGRSQSVLWDFSTYTGVPGMSFGGDVPWAWAGEQFATIDPTALSASDMLADNVGVLSELARTNNMPNEWWLKGYGNFGQYGANGINNDYAYLNGGIAAGASFTLDENLDLGAFVGYQASNLRVNSRWVTSQTILGNGVVAGIYGTATLNNMFADLALYGGWSANSSNRFVNDNLQSLGEDNALIILYFWPLRFGWV